MAAAGAEIYRLNLEQGRFLAPLALSSLTSPSAVGSNALAQSALHGLLAVGREDGCVECFDVRDRSSAAVLDIGRAAGGGGWEGAEVSSLCYSGDGLCLGAGMSNGRVLLFDLRSSRPLVEKDHRYGLPVLAVAFHPSSRNVVSTDAKSIRFWSQQTGAAYTSIESEAALKDCLVWPDSGLVMATGEQQRVQVWYVPELGAAPAWCSFLDSLTEELEERQSTSVYEEYQFVTQQQLEDWGCSQLIGSNLLRAYMHGYFMHSRLYQRLAAAAAEAGQPGTQTTTSASAALASAQLQRQREKTGDRILQRKAGSVKVNAAYAQQLMQKGSAKRRLREAEEKQAATETLGEEEADAAAVSSVLADPLGDPRFARMFRDEEFRIDEGSEEYRRLHPSQQQQGGQRKAADRRKQEEEEEEERKEAMQAAGAALAEDEHYELVQDDTPLHGEGDDSEEEDDDVDGDEEEEDAEDEAGDEEKEQSPAAIIKQVNGKRPRDAAESQRQRKRTQMFELKQVHLTRARVHTVPHPLSCAGLTVCLVSLLSAAQGLTLPSLLQTSVATQPAAANQREMTLQERLRLSQSQPAPTLAVDNAADGQTSRRRGGGRGRGRGRGRAEGGDDAGNRRERRGMRELLGPDRAPVVYGKWARGGRGRGGGAGRGSRGRGRGGPRR